MQIYLHCRAEATKRSEANLKGGWWECQYRCGVSAQKNRAVKTDCSIFEVRIKGLEPPRLSASDPKSDVATNYTISASVCRHRSETLGKVSKFIRNLMPCAMKISNNHHFSTFLLHKPPFSHGRGNPLIGITASHYKKMRPLLEQPPPVFFR